MNIDNIELSLIIDRSQIKKRIDEMAYDINCRYGNEPFIVICVLKGAFVFCSDLLRSINNHKVIVDFIRVASYGSGTKNSGQIILKKDIECDIEGKNVLIVEDILDTGLTLQFIQQHFKTRNYRSIRTAVLLEKTDQDNKTITVDFVGFKTEGFVVGYGLDYAEHFRELPDIYKIINF